MTALTRSSVQETTRKSFSCLNTDQSKVAISTLFYSYNHPNSGSYVYAPAGDVMTMYSDNDLRKDVSITTLDNLNFINKYPSGQKGTDPVVISRLAEMYLISAEAQGVEKGLGRLNELRQMRGLEKIFPGSENEFINAVLDERRLELLCEGHRWYDLVRTGKAVEKLGIKEYQTLMPIPEASDQPQSYSERGLLIYNGQYHESKHIKDNCAGHPFFCDAVLQFFR